MTTFEVTLDAGESDRAAQGFEPLIADGLVRLDGEKLTVAAEGRPFLRNVATVFDAYFDDQPSTGPVYSTSV